MKNEYIAPEITVVEFRTERGFSDSCPTCQIFNHGDLNEQLEIFAAEQNLYGFNHTQNTNNQGYSLGGFTGEDITGYFGTF